MSKNYPRYKKNDKFLCLKPFKLPGLKVKEGDVITLLAEITAEITSFPTPEEATSFLDKIQIFEFVVSKKNRKTDSVLMSNIVLSVMIESNRITKIN